MTPRQRGSPCLDGDGTSVLPRGHLSPKHLFPELTTRRVRKPGASVCDAAQSLPFHLLHPSPGWRWKGLGQRAGTGVEGCFSCCHFLGCCEKPKSSLASRCILCTSPWALVRSVQQPSGWWGTRTWRSLCLLLQSSPLPCPVTLAPVTPKLLLGLGAGARMGCGLG